MSESADLERSKPSGLRSLALPVLVVLGVAITLYGPTLGHDFVYDDARFIRDNARLEQIGNPLDFFTDPVTVDPSGGWEGIYRPLRTLSFAVDRQIFGVDPFGYHLVNLVLHAVASVLVLLVLRRILPSAGGAFIGAVLFAAHPAAVEAVAWATSRDNGLCLVFSLAALWIYLLRKDGVLGLTALALTFSLALFGKEFAIAIPVFAVLAEVTIHGKDTGGLRAFARGLGRRWRAWATLAVVGLVYLFLRYEVLGEGSGQRTLWWDGSAEVTRLTAVEALAMYAARAFVPWWPAPVTFDYQVALVRSVSDPAFLVSAVFVLGSIFAALFVRRRFPYVTLLVLWFWLALLPTANLLFPINILFADRFLYLSLVAASGLLGWLAADLGRRMPRASIAIVAVPFCAFFFLSAVNVDIWKSPQALWGNVLERFPDNPRALRAYAYSLSDGPEDRARCRQLLEHALVVEPDFPPARRDLALLHLAEGRTEEGLQQLRILVERHEASEVPQGFAEYVDACHRLVLRLTDQGRYREAVPYGERLLRAAPDDPALRTALGELYARMGQLSVARQYFEEALRLDPGYAPALRGIEEL